MSSAMSVPVVIVGAGHAAGEMASSLRMNGYEGSITVIGDEPYPPYQRPPLSKAFLCGDLTVERLYLKTAAAYKSASIELIPDVRVTAIDRTSKTVTLVEGRTLPYGTLVLATGSRPRNLTLPDERVNRAPNLHYLRTIGHVENLRQQFKPGSRLVIIGGGYIGLEVAAVARKMDIDVTILEAAPRLLARVTAPAVSAFYRGVHNEAGVKIRVGVDVQGFEFNDAGRITAVLATGEEKAPADLVIVGIGVIPNTELADAAGLTINNGIAVDEYGRTSDPNIFAIGDCSSHPNAYAGRHLRLESVPSALEQARSAAALLVGQDRPYNTVPWFWSDQYDLKLQMAGLNQGYDTVTLRGSPANRNFLAFYLKDGVLLAVDSVNRSQDFVIARKLVAERIKISAVDLMNESMALKDMLPRRPTS